MDTEVATVLPRELRLGVPPTMPQARSYLFRQQSTRSSYTPSQTIQINIPRLQRSYLRKDSYIRFTLDTKLSGTSADQCNITLDSAGAFGFFEKIEIFDYLGSTVLESISGAPQLAALLLDLGMEKLVNNTTGNVSAGLGTETATVWQLPIQGGAANTSGTFTQSMMVRPSSFGKTIEPSIVRYDAEPGSSTVQYGTSEFAIPLLSFLGLLSKKMVPLHNGFTILITLAQQYTPFFMWEQQSSTNIVPKSQYSIAVTGSNAVTPAPAILAANQTIYSSVSLDWVVRDVYMTCQILELGPVAESMLLSSSQGQPLIVHTKSFRNYAGTIASGANISEMQLNLNLNVASLTNIFWFMRAQDDINNKVKPSIGHRTRNFLSRWWFQYGSTTLPQSNGIIAFGQTYPTSDYYPGNVEATNGKNNEYNTLCLSATESFQELMKARPVEWGNNRIDLWSYCADWVYNKKLDSQSGALACVGANMGEANLPSPNNFLGLGKFAAGLNLELCTGKAGDLVCGLNTNGMNTSIRAQFHPSFLSYMTSVLVDAFAEYDAFINISPGIATTVSF